MVDTWHNWHKPEVASEMEVPAVAQWQGQQHLKSALVSVVAAEPHHADPMMLEAPSKREPWLTDERNDILEDTTVTRGVAVIAMLVEA